MITVRTFHSKTLIFSLNKAFYEIMNETSYTYYKGQENNNACMQLTAQSTSSSANAAAYSACVRKKGRLFDSGDCAT